ncbi:DUF4228 domain-containing protein [Cephalotus follicularis]|uniref:DUF4228 domain-containing protein n=1 Tax=Cephalotus follicularis TaxID=3775 RepID=A0A1Q3C6X7_CEPFO|nr:DUF4228 domain-containing protein [Cephalotus follicularis]
MGNVIGGRKKAKVMKINGETMKIETPVKVWDVTKDYPGHVLLDSEAVKHFGIRAKPLELQQELKPKKVYFLLELPKSPAEERLPRRVRSSGMHLGAKDRLELLMLSRRSVSDLSMVRPSSGRGTDGAGPSNGPVRVTMRLPKAQLARLVEESKDDVEVAEKIIHLYTADGDAHLEVQREAGLGNKIGDYKKRVSFVPKEKEKFIQMSPLNSNNFIKNAE